MIFYDYYSDIPEDTLRQFVARQELGRFITASAAGQPHIGLYPFVRERKAKWKLAQNRTRERRAAIIAQLRQRGRPTDASAADALQWTLDHEATK